jgi:hypothetical protein
VAPDAVVVDLHGHPGLLLPGIEAGLGLLLLVVPLGLAPRATAGAGPPAKEVALEAGVPPPRRLPGLMLLNVDPAADAGAVEHAPPLGRRSEVAQRLEGIFPGLGVDEDGRGCVRGEHWTLTLDCGRDDTVWTITLDGRGDGSIGAIETLAAATGWRIFVPRRGGFVSPADLRAGRL